MPTTRRTTRHPEGRLQRIADEAYVGALAGAAVLIIGVGLVALTLYVFDFSWWVALND